MAEEDFNTDRGKIVYDSLKQAYNVSRSLLEVDKRFQKLMAERGYKEVGTDEPVWKVENWIPERK
jgi:hypothetical protein